LGGWRAYSPKKGYANVEINNLKGLQVIYFLQNITYQHLQATQHTIFQKEESMNEK
jgi:hypothetical protein